MKVAVIAVAKNEELYIKEWLDYHLNLGFDTIIVADNDDELILSGYSSENVVIEDYTGVNKVQSKAYTELFIKYRKDYDWIAFFDIDEFIVIEGKNVKDFLSEFDADEVRLNEKHFTDNDELDVIDGNYNVFNRFKIEADVPDLNRYLKSFINTKINTEIGVLGHGIYDTNIKAVNALNQPIMAASLKSKELVLEKAWFNHYRTKTIGEYIRQKTFRGGPNNNPKRYSDWENYFFQTNQKTQEKINYANKLINYEIYTNFFNIR